jgi:hypothetical protein
VLLAMGLRVRAVAWTGLVQIGGAPVGHGAILGLMI